MPMDARDIESMIKAAIPDAEVTIRDLAGDGRDHRASGVLSGQGEDRGSGVGRRPSLRANGSRERAPDDRLREAIHAARAAAWIASALRARRFGGLPARRSLRSKLRRVVAYAPRK